MKRIVLFLVIGFYGLLLFSQNIVDVSIDQPELLKADAGTDIIITEGSTVQIGGSPTADHGYGNYSYSWFPSDNLSDASSSNPDASVQNSTIFFVTVTDAMECTATDSVAVSVNGATDLLKQRAAPVIKIVPNPNQGAFMIEMDNTTLLTGIDIVIRDISGKEVFSRFTGIQSGMNEIPVNISTLPEGNYIIEIFNECLQYIQKLVVY